MNNEVKRVKQLEEEAAALHSEVRRQ
jgi:hypothetical protein